MTTLDTCRAWFGRARSYASFARGMRAYLAQPMTAPAARALIQRRLAEREHNFLALARSAIYPHPRSPYCKLLALAGCQYGDLERLVRADGLDTTLRHLYREGVYVSLDEFKGRRPAVRGSQTVTFDVCDFDNPTRAGDITLMSGGSRSVGTRTIYDFDFMAAALVPSVLSRCDAWDLLRFPVGLWFPIMPGCGPIYLLLFAKMGKPPLRWFSQTDNRQVKPSLKSRVGTAAIVRMGRLLGQSWPAPEHTPIGEAGRVVDWMASIIREHGGCVLETYVSTAARVCQAARERGVDLRGAAFAVTGEPLSRAKRAEMEAAGARVFPNYAFSEGGAAGAGCPRFVEPDEVHLRSDMFALIQQPREVPHAQVSVDAFYFTALLPQAPKILLNFESGDYGVINRRNCGCQFQAMGFHDHIHTIRAFDKLTSEGMTFVGTDMLRLIEEVLPREFGGISTDYQMVEEEDDRGRTIVSIVVNPALGSVDEARLIQVVMAQIGREKDYHRMMAEVWGQAGTLRVRRAAPYTTARGKLLPLHIQEPR